MNNVNIVRRSLMNPFRWWYLEEAKQWCGYQIKVLFLFPSILCNANIRHRFCNQTNAIYTVIRDLCSSMEGFNNPPKLRRNSSAAANISNLASSSNQGYYYKHLNKENCNILILYSFRHMDKNI